MDLEVALSDEPQLVRMDSGQLEQVLMNLAINAVDAMPKHLVDLAFVLDFQSANTGKYREGYEDLLLAESALTVTFAKVLKPLDQMASHLDALVIETQVIKTILDRSTLPGTDVTWTSTARTLTPSREHLLTAIVFRIEHDLAYGVAA